MEFQNTLFTRHTIRSFTSEQISEEQLSFILRAGMAAPVSHKTYHDIIFTVVQDKTLLHVLASHADSSSDPFYHAPTVIFISSRNTKIPAIAPMNAACIAENMLLAATSENLGGVLLTFCLQEICKSQFLLNELSIPEHYSPLAAVAIGLPTKNAPAADPVLSISKRIHVIRK